MEVRGATRKEQDLGWDPAPLDLVRSRLAELVVHLSDCEPGDAIAAVRDVSPAEPPADHDARLAVVAAALLQVRRRIDLREPKPGASGARPAPTSAVALPR